MRNQLKIKEISPVKDCLQAFYLVGPSPGVKGTATKRSGHPELDICSCNLETSSRRLKPGKEE